MFVLKGRRRGALGAVTAAVALTATAAGVVASDGDRSDSVKRAVDDGKARNVIVLIGDGMDEQSITMARNYDLGAGGRFAMDTLPFTGDKTTFSVREDAPDKPDYTPESASTATHFSTGVKTSDGRISTSPGTDRDLTTVLELAQRRGMRTGNVATSELTDATPAAPMSHIRFRACQGPQDMATCPQDRRSAGGPGSIAEQSVDKGVDVLLGGGARRYDQPITEGPDAGRTVSQAAAEKGYRVVRTKAELAAVDPGQKVLGLFNEGNQSVEWDGQPAAQPANGPQRCDRSNENQARTTEPSLEQSTRKAIELLDAPARGRGRGDGNRPGFFLQVESASIDKREHSSEPCESIGETVAFDRAVKAALDFAARDKNTLVIVTGDHTHTPQIVEPGQQTAGPSSILTTDEGEQMKISYGTSDSPNGQGHTGAQMRIAAQGPQAANVLGLIDDTDQAKIVARALGGEDDEREHDDD